MTVTIFVAGVPAPQGSKTKTRWGMREDNPNTKPWRATVAAEAADVMDGQELLGGALRLTVAFQFPRPRSHFGTGRNAEMLKLSAPDYHSTKPDLDKLLRAVGDALTGTAIRDDARIAVVHASKKYGTPAGVWLELDEISA